MNIKEIIQQKINNKTKPLGSLGQLESLAMQIAMVQKTDTPKLIKPNIVVFAADHGIASEGVSAYPAEVTPQMVYNFLNGGAAINVFCKQNGINLSVVDSGVNADFNETDLVIRHKIAYGTRSFLSDRAMDYEQLMQCFSYSEKLIRSIALEGCTVIGFGEMGIGNTSSAALIVHSLSSLSLEQSVGRGTGMDNDGLKRKLEILQKAKDFHGSIEDPLLVLQTYGGFEVAQMTAAMLEAYRNGMLIMVDGYIASAAFLVAYKINPNILGSAVFCHCSQENGHRILLKELGVTAMLDLELRLGEGTGCALAYPLLQAAVNFLNEMASFETAGVSNKA
ncbi:MAG: nicotinate-nucleotide--dimethylbenzimidazole phosphoribosyltransferase [Bacteroidetes bacterium]|nr:nicotinate-nucleotide--dimethylbenzimidazole phosphoribosyltransferase [Bacteroidota bacterium]